MKQSISLLFTNVTRGNRFLIDTKLLLCLLLAVSVGLLSSCDRDMGDLSEDLSKESLTVCWVSIDNSSLDVQQATKLTAEVYYSGEDRELQYNWSVEEDKGKILNDGKRATYVAPEKAGTYLIRFEVCNGPITASDTVPVTVVELAATEGMSSDTTNVTNATGAGDPTTVEMDDQNPDEEPEENAEEPAQPAENAGEAKPEE